MKNSKKISVSTSVWERLEDFKLKLQNKLQQQVNWDEVFTFFLNENYFSKNKTKSIIKPHTQIKTPTSLPNSKQTNTRPLYDQTLGIPPAPKKKPIQVNLNKKDMKLLAKKETKETKYILIECKLCGTKPIIMPIPKKIVLEAHEPVVDISYIHGNPEHVIVAQLDHDFQVRRRRVSQVVYEKDYH
ncbi:MAG: hypothetical protein DRO88_07270 [Promethearchaeia archaeon]|nr:MAG: hypothetical protein DRO88_07270 [Candidatus Lokiarchaeia archaeon]